MALTKVTGQVIKNTTDVTVGVLTVTNTLAVGGTVSIGGTLTYEDVTNVDAVGLITARNGIVVGSGITLSKDGDGFFTGVTTAASFKVGDGGPGADEDRFAVGASEDLKIYHDGNSVIYDNGAGDLKIYSNGGAVKLQKDTDEDMVVANTDGAVELYHNNSKKIETSSSGITVSSDNSTGSILKGVTRFTPNDSTTVKVMWDETGFSGAGHFQVKDGVAFTAGDSSDLKIYHDGSNSRIADAGTGYLINTSNGDGILFQHSSGQNLAKFFTGGAVELYHNYSKKFETSSSGVTISGGTVANGHITLPDHTGSQDGKLRFGASTDFEIFHNGTSNNTEVNHTTNTGHLQITSNRLKLMNYDGPETYIDCISNGAVELYYNNSKKFETNTNGNQVTGQLVIPDGGNNTGNNNITFGSDNDHHAYHNGSHMWFVNNTGNIYMRAKAGEDSIVAIPDGAVELYHDNSKKAETNADGFRVSGALQSSSGTGNYYLRTAHTNIQENGGSVTITLSGLTFSFGVFRIGGYASAGQASVSLHIIFGGYMTHINNYNATVLANHAQNCTISQTKNNSNYVITITNNANNYDLFCNMMIESANSAFAIALS